MVELDTATERIYQQAEIDNLIDELLQLRTKCERQSRELIEVKTQQRLLYNDVKKIYNILPFDGETINMAKIPRIATALMNNPESIKSFEGIRKFIEEFETKNLIVK